MGGDRFLGEDGQKPFQFMLTWHKQRQPFEEVAISPETGAASAPGREHKMWHGKSLLTPSLDGGGRAAAIPADRETPRRGAAARHA
jgi:hypothetical protein